MSELDAPTTSARPLEKTLPSDYYRIASRPHDHGYYAPMEDLSLDIRRYVGERLGLE